jgi:hypothetical protein
VTAFDAAPLPAGRKSPGLKFRDAVNAEKPLQLVGTIKREPCVIGPTGGFRAIYLRVAELQLGRLRFPISDFARVYPTRQASQGVATRN